MSDSPHIVSPSTRSPSPTNRSMPTVLIETQQHQRQTGAHDDLVNGLGLNSNISNETDYGDLNWDDRLISNLQLESDAQSTPVVSNVDPLLVPSPKGDKQSISASQPINESFGFSSYFGGNDSAQQDSDVFCYDYSAQYSTQNDQNQSYETINDYIHQEPFSTLHESVYHDNNSSDYFSTEYQQTGDAGFNQSNFQEYYFPQETYNQETRFVANNIQTNEDLHEYWTQTEYFNETEYYNVDLNAPCSHSLSHFQNTGHLRPRNLCRPPEPHPIVSFAFGGKIMLSIVKTSSSRNCTVMQDIEITLRPGKIRVCPLLSILKNTTLERCIKEFPGPISSSTNISSICQNQLTFCHSIQLLWKLVDVLASNKGSWNAERVTSLLTPSAETISHDAYLGSRSNFCTTPCLTQPPSSLKVNDDDIVYLQSLVTAGKHTEAADFAAKKGLWSHALIISLNSDAGIHSSIIQRYRDSFLVPGSQLHTVYSVLAHCPIQSTESWKENLAALFNIPKGSVPIFQLGELLLAEGNIEAAHACFLLSGRLEKIWLLGLGEQSSRIFQCPYPYAVQLTECFENSVRQKDSSFVLETLVYAKFAYACLLIDLGLNNIAFRYLGAVSRSIADLTKPKRNTFPEKFCLAVKKVDHLLSQIASRDNRSESSGVLGSIFNNISKLLIGKEELDIPVPPMQPKINSSHVSEPTVPDPPKIEKADGSTEPLKDGILSKLTGFFRSRNPSPTGDLSEFEEEEKFHWDPVTKKWISNLTGPPQPIEPQRQETVITRPPFLNPLPNASQSQLPRSSLRRTDINSRYALEERQRSLPPDPAHQIMQSDVNYKFNSEDSDSAAFTGTASVRPALQPRFPSSTCLPRAPHRPFQRPGPSGTS